MHLILDNVKVVNGDKNERELFFAQRIVHFDVADFFFPEQTFTAVNFFFDANHELFNFS
ncbi:hypothetical protein ADICYQ_3712 [Cyclobacterium qasimii M12-11B]|uniref:Uncharacterized protein n=1 Tax=Cyclobacterium qasimii M12-11B TaxID=641524 RepID=S7VCJ7_9BACT|nr:hypothetical protein ADICYQ_3712 [Cyclobacterium qasimii M12-11B]